MPEPRQRLVLAVNHDPAQVKSLADAADAVGADFISFSEADRALEYIQKEAAPDLIITDLHTTGIDGWRFCRLLRSPAFKTANRTPLLVTSAIYSGTDVQEISRDLGASDFLSVPCDEKALLTTVRGLLKGHTSPAKPLVLIVEDEPMTASMLSRVMKKHGYETLDARGPADARVLFAKHHPNVVITDHHLAENAIGLDLIRDFKKPGTHVVVIVVTGDLSSDLAVKYSREGADAFVHKPFDTEYLISLISKAQRQRALLRVEELLVQKIRSLRENDAKILQASRLASLGELAAGVAHEINNPINGMMNCAEILAAQFEQGTEGRRFAEMIRSEGERVSTIVRRLLNMARPQEEQPEAVNILDLVQGILLLLESQISRGGIDVEVSIPDGLHDPICRRVQIQQVIMNLLINSCDALGQRYPGADPNKKLLVRADKSTIDGHSFIVISIEDHGCGIPSDRIPLLFNPFYTTKENGTGLGLSISHGIIKAHGGWITVESQISVITKFRVYLPNRRPDTETAG